MRDLQNVEFSGAIFFPRQWWAEWRRLLDLYEPRPNRTSFSDAVYLIYMTKMMAERDAK